MTNKKILIVDDSALVLEIYKDLLASQGFDVITRNTPFGTASFISSEKPDIVLLDIFMPGLSGDKLVDIIRKNKATQDVILLLFSDRPLAELQSIASICGADGCIQKTKNHAEVIQKVRSFVANLNREQQAD